MVGSHSGRRPWSRERGKRMCLAVPGKVIRKVGDDAEIDLQGNRLQVSTVLVPEAARDRGCWYMRASRSRP